MKTSHLTALQRDTLRKALDAKREELSAALAHLDEARAQGHDDSPEIGDVAEACLEDRERAALEAHDRALLREVDHALSKIDSPAFGLSEVSGRPIAFERLRSLPWARTNAHEATRLEHDAGRG